MALCVGPDHPRLFMGSRRLLNVDLNSGGQLEAWRRFWKSGILSTCSRGEIGAPCTKPVEVLKSVTYGALNPMLTAILE